MSITKKKKDKIFTNIVNTIYLLIVNTVIDILLILFYYKLLTNLHLYNCYNFSNKYD